MPAAGVAFRSCRLSLSLPITVVACRCPRLSLPSPAAHVACRSLPLLAPTALVVRCSLRTPSLPAALVACRFCAYRSRHMLLSFRSLAALLACCSRRMMLSLLMLTLSLPYVPIIVCFYGWGRGPVWPLGLCSNAARLLPIFVPSYHLKFSSFPLEYFAQVVWRIHSFRRVSACTFSSPGLSTASFLFLLSNFSCHPSNPSNSSVFQISHSPRRVFRLCYPDQ